MASQTAAWPESLAECGSLQGSPGHYGRLKRFDLWRAHDEICEFMNGLFNLKINHGLHFESILSIKEEINTHTNYKIMICLQKNENCSRAAGAEKRCERFSNGFGPAMSGIYHLVYHIAYPGGIMWPPGAVSSNSKQANESQRTRALQHL